MFQDIPDALIQAPEGLPVELTNVWIGVALTLFIIDRVWYIFRSRQKKANASNPSMEDKISKIHETVEERSRMVEELHRAITGDGVNPGMHQILIDIRDSLKGD